MILKRETLFILSFLLITIISCSKKVDDKNKIIDLTSSQLSNEVFYYSNYFIKNKLDKKENYLTKEEILRSKNESFFYLYRIKINNNSAKVLFLRVRSGEMFEYFLKKENEKWKITKVDDYRTKVETNEGTKLFWEIQNVKI